MAPRNDADKLAGNADVDLFRFRSAAELHSFESGKHGGFQPRGIEELRVRKSVVLFGMHALENEGIVDAALARQSGDL